MSIACHKNGQGITFIKNLLIIHNMQEQIYDMLLKEDDVTWKDLIFNLIKSEQMDPWNVDITKLTKKYIETLKQMKEMNYYISGKVLLASAVLLKLKSNRLVEEDINNFDSFLFHTDEEFYEELDDFAPYQHDHKIDIPRLGIKTPQARKRKVSVKDLISALEKALRVDTRRRLRLQSFLTFNKPEIPEKKIDMNELINKLYEQVLKEFDKRAIVTFDELLPEGKKKEDIILTMLPLLHLHNNKRINIDQHEHFGEITVEKHTPTSSK